VLAAFGGVALTFGAQPAQEAKDFSAIFYSVP